MRSGLDLNHIDQSVRAQDDLFRFMNGKWLKESVIPADRASDGAFYRLYEEAEKQVKEIILQQAQSKGPIGSNAQKIGDLYGSFMDEARIEALGISPIKLTFISKALTIKVVRNRAEKLAGKYILILNDSTIRTILNLISKVTATTKIVCHLSPIS